jgi:hypothetical protein
VLEADHQQQVMLPRSSLQLLQPKVATGSAHVGCTDECEVAGISVSCSWGRCLHHEPCISGMIKRWAACTEVPTPPPRTCFHLCILSGLSYLQYLCSQVNAAWRSMPLGLLASCVGAISLPADAVQSGPSEDELRGSGCKQLTIHVTFMHGWGCSD